MWKLVTEIVCTNNNFWNINLTFSWNRSKTCGGECRSVGFVESLSIYKVNKFQIQHDPTHRKTEFLNWNTTLPL